jgi:ATP/maltotriose-dependent transcriptional regulator MalT
MNLLQSKLRIPPVRREHVPRPRLHTLLRAGLEGRVTLVSAPAGFGKTSLLSEWLQSQDLPVAWLSLDEQDNAWPRFLAYLLTAVQAIDPSVGTGLLGALESPQVPALESVRSSLPGELAVVGRPFVLVLDDFHVLLDAQVHDLLTSIIDHEPAGMHLVLSGRSDPPWPVGRLRAAGALTEIRAADLRFTLDEAGQLLNDSLALRLSLQDLSTVEERTEGWIVGLHLAALSLRNQADRPGFLRAFAGSDRFVLDYLMEEVLSQQPPEVCTFLLETSLLDRFSAPLCDAITGHADSQAMLRRLEADNLFVVSLDSERCWYAYHSLMGSFLRSVQKQRDPGSVASIHLHASEWYEANGDILDAIQHGLAAEDYERIGQLIRSNGLALVFQGDLSTVLAWLHTYSETWLRTGPWLRIAQLWAHSFSSDAPTISGELQETRELVREGLRAFEDQSDSPKVLELRQALAHLTAIEANVSVMSGRHAEAARLAREALAELPPKDTTTRQYAFVCLGMALRHQGELQAAVDALAAADPPGSELDQTAAPARGLATLAGIQIWMGRLQEAETTCRRLLTLHDEYLNRCGRRLPIAAFGYARLSEILRERNQLDEALRLAQESHLLAVQWQQTDALFESHTQLARARLARKDTDGAFALLHALETQMRGSSPWLHALTRAEEARLCLMCAQDPGCLKRARAWAREYPLPADGRLVFRDHPLYLAHAQLLLWEAREDRSRARAAVELTKKVMRLLEPTDALGLLLQACVLCALSESAFGQTGEALSHLVECLHRAEPRGYVRLFADCGPALGALLAQVPAPDPSHVYAQMLSQVIADDRAAGSAGQGTPRLAARAPMEEPLSERELHVLRLLATTLTSSEIADELSVATSTVRSHTKAIYSKLGVHSRLEAVDQARSLGLL